jgi:hypothetical protein
MVVLDTDLPSATTALPRQLGVQLRLGFWAACAVLSIGVLADVELQFLQYT